MLVIRERLYAHPVDLLANLGSKAGVAFCHAVSRNWLQKRSIFCNNICYVKCLINKHLDSSASIVTRLGAGQPTNCGSLPARCKRFLFYTSRPAVVLSQLPVIVVGTVSAVDGLRQPVREAKH